MSAAQGEAVLACITRELAAHGVVRPPWQLRDEHPCSLFWRMGEGELHLMAFSSWWPSLQLDDPARLALVSSWRPPPVWYPWCAFLLFPELEEASDDPELAERMAVERLEREGLGSVAAWQDAEQEG